MTATTYKLKICDEGNVWNCILFILNICNVPNLGFNGYGRNVLATLLLVFYQLLAMLIVPVTHKFFCCRKKFLIIILKYSGLLQEIKFSRIASLQQTI